MVGTSPTLIAASYVLHRHLLPRHPPYALCNDFLELRFHINTLTRTHLITIDGFEYSIVQILVPSGIPKHGAPDTVVWKKNPLFSPSGYRVHQLKALAL